ncbi:MAG: hypothetical protein K8T90_11690 [Planctomycetes bacterium]|nr:hypothetical protein [Planctomycetota bacterium]
MRVLFDQGTPAPLRHALVGHAVEIAFERGWSRLQNGELIASAESAGFDVLVTTDTNLKYQQNLRNRRIALVVLRTTSWPRVRRSLSVVVAAVASASTGSYTEVDVEPRARG